MQERNHTLLRIEEETKALQAAREQVQATQKAQAFLQELAQAVQQQAIAHIASVVSRCLSAVFGGKYELEIQFVKVRGRTEAKLLYRKCGHFIDPDVDSGGVRELTALALRLASLLLVLPPTDRVLDLDEPFAGISATNMPKIAQLLKTLSEELGVQFIIRTHSPCLTIGKIVRL